MTWPGVDALNTPPPAVIFPFLMYTHQKLKSHLRRTLTLPALILSFGAHAVAQEATDTPMEGLPARVLQEPMENIHTALQEIDSRLSSAQEEALEIEDVKKAQQALEKQVNDLIIEGNPELELVIKKHADLQKELIEHPELQDPTTPPSEEIQQRIMEYQVLDQQIGPARQAAFQDSAVRDARDAFQARLLEEMGKIDPETPQLIERGQALIAQLQEQQMRQQMQMQQQMQQMQQSSEAPARRAAPSSDAGPTQPEAQSEE